MQLLHLALCAILSSSVVANFPKAFCDVDHEILCGNQCMPMEFVCDNVRDCHNGMDEESCDYLHRCPIGDFMCRTGECVSSFFKCNGIAECSDGSDENGCDTLRRIEVRLSHMSTKTLAIPKLNDTLKPAFSRVTTTPATSCVAPEQFHCVSSNQCIPGNKRCDGHQDCMMGEDESGCVNVQCLDLENHRMCNDNKICLRIDLFCDGVQNCLDGSDELDCNYANLPTAEDYLLPNDECPSSQFTCGDGQCLDRQLVCDNHLDCIDGSDESNRCNECESFGCSYKCINTPKGPECLCPPNSLLASDFRSCDTDDLCSVERNKCSQFCHQSYGAISCFCSPGYHLVSTTKCVVDEAYQSGSLFFTYNQTSVRRTNIFNNSLFYEDFVPPMKIEHITSMSFNPHTHNIYLAIELSHHETRVMLSNGELNKWFLSGHHIKHIAVDWITNNLYYAAESHVPSLGVCTPSGRYCRKIYEPVKFDLFNSYHFEGLLFYPKRAQLIFLERHHENVDGAVFVCDADGSYPRRLDHLDIGRKSAIALDYVTDRLYIAADGIMHRIDLNTLRQHPVEVAVFPRAFIVFNGFFYFIERESNALKRAKFGEDPVLLHQLQPHDYAIAINNSLYYPSVPNPCLALGCSHICVLKHRKEGSTPEGTCLCPDQYKLVNGKCIFESNHYKLSVHLSGPRMAELCEVNNICENGGVCNKTILDNGHTKLICECPSGFVGLYCEISIPLNDEVMSSPRFFIFVAGTTSSLIVLLVLVACLRYPKFCRRVSVVATNISSPRSTYAKRKTVISPAQNSASAGLSRFHTGDVNYFSNPVFEDTGSPLPLETTNLTHELSRSPSEAFIVDETLNPQNPLFY